MSYILGYKNRDSKLGNKAKNTSLNKWKFNSGYEMSNYRIKKSKIKKQSKTYIPSRYTNG